MNGSGPLATDEDALLNDRVREGDREAFRILALRHEPFLHSFLGRVAGHAQASDLVQDVLLRAWLRADAYRGEGSYRGWLLRIGWRLFLDQRRTARRRGEQRTADAGEYGDHMVNPAGPAAAELEQLLTRLSHEQRAALVLCDGHGWTHAEAADILAIPLGTVKSHIARAKHQLRDWQGRDGAA